MWEFMCNYADNFWAGTEYAYNIFEVIMAWAITLGIAAFVAKLVYTLLHIIFVVIEEKINRAK